mmetsp:Transcript_2038/g.3602  ORF Transcript_2038/g.3602 Transcript_2038/m.3602 type:complete len:166 (-) Transcript_2038:1729-2226(-)
MYRNTQSSTGSNSSSLGGNSLNMRKANSTQEQTNSSGSYRGNRNLLFGGVNSSSSSGGGRSGGNNSVSVYERETLERDNNTQVDGLNDKVGIMKDIAIQIGNEVDLHNQMLQKMDGTFDSAQGLLAGTMERLSDMVESGNVGKPFLYLIAFLLFFFFALYLLFRR